MKSLCDHPRRCCGNRPVFVEQVVQLNKIWNVKVTMGKAFRTLCFDLLPDNEIDLL